MLKKYSDTIKNINVMNLKYQWTAVYEIAIITDISHEYVFHILTKHTHLKTLSVR